MTTDEIERIFSDASRYAGSISNVGWSGTVDIGTPAIRSTCAQNLEAAGKVVGMIGVASRSGYSAIQRRTFAIFAHQVGSAIGLALQYERRQEMVDAMVNLRADLDRSEKQRLINHERARSVARRRVTRFPARARHPPGRRRHLGPLARGR